MLNDNDKLHLAVIWTIDVLAIITNLALMAAILFRTPKPLRTYSIFLLNNAIIDFCSATASAMGTSRLVEDHEGINMIFVFLGPCTLISEHLCRFCQGLHVNLVLQSTAILLLSFAYRLHILNVMFRERPPPSRLLIWLICGVTYVLIALPIAASYIVQTEVDQGVVQRFYLEGYITSNFYLFGTLALMVNGNAIVLSPTVMILIFIVRRKLVKRISQAQSVDTQQHRLIARVLTYQMLLPLGGAVAVTIWMLDLAQIWTNEFNQRVIMVLFNIFSLSSPLINFTMLPPYRALLPFWRTSSIGVQQQIEFTSMAG